jgi:hypothetical protein
MKLEAMTRSMAKPENANLAAMSEVNRVVMAISPIVV